MKKTSILFSILALMLLSSCGGGSDEDSTTENELGAVNNGMQALLNQAQAVVLAQYPDTRLYEARGYAGDGSASFFTHIDHWTFVYCVGNCLQTVILRWTEGTFGNPGLINQPWLEDEFIPLPLTTSVDDAIKSMSAAGYTMPFSRLYLRKPTPFQASEAYYIFVLQDNTYVCVGVDSEEVKCPAV